MIAEAFGFQGEGVGAGAVMGGGAEVRLDAR